MVACSVCHKFDTFSKVSQLKININRFYRIIVAGIRSVPGREHTRPALQRDQVQGPALRHPQAPQEQHQAHFQVS